MGVIPDRIRPWLGLSERNAVIPAWPSGVDNFWPYANIGGMSYPLDGLTMTMPGSREEEIESNFRSYVGRAYKGNSVVFSLMRDRMSLFSQARFQWRTFETGKLFGDKSLAILEHPMGPTSTTGDLLARAISDADLAGNFYATRRKAKGSDRIVRMRPDWVTMVFGTNDPDVSSDDLDAELLGLIYYPGGEYAGGKPVYLTRDQFAHWAPVPDPEAHARGMSWITPIVREVMGDGAATTHKLKFFENAGTPQMVVSRKDAPAKEVFREWRDIIEEGHKGVANAYRTLYLTNGAEAQVVGTSLAQVEFAVTQGHGETRMAMASGIHPVIAGASEGLAGSSLNAGNFNAARRLVADKTMWWLWGNFCGSMEVLVAPPSGAQLWIDASDIPFLRDDRKDAADIQQVKAQSIASHVDKGFTRESAVAAVDAEDVTLLKADPAVTSVQVQPTTGPGAPEPATVPTVPALAEAASAALLTELLIRRLELPQLPAGGGSATHPTAVPPWWERLTIRYSATQPRRPDGKFGSGGAPTAGDGTGAGTKDDPIKTGDVAVAQQALADGKYVELESERQVSTLVDRLASDMRAAEAAGKPKTDYDLCKVSVPGTNLFCSQSKGIPRAQMPQLKGKPIPGSAADSLPKNAKGEADISAAFTDHLRSKGIAVTDGNIDAKYLKASQNQIDGEKVIGMAGAIRSGKLRPEPIFVTEDDYVVDGHHRWAANVVAEYQGGKAVTMPTHVIHADIIEVLNEANSFAADMGLPQQGVTQRAGGASAHPFVDWSLTSSRYSATQPRRPDGKFGSGSGGNLDYGSLEKQAEAGGFSVTVHGKAPRSGYMVSPYKAAERTYAADKFTADDVHAYRDNHRALLARPNHYMGGWRDGDTIYLDVSVHASSAAKASSLAKEHKQEAYFDLSTGSTVYTQQP